MCVRAALKVFPVPVDLTVCHARSSLFHLLSEEMLLHEYYYEEE